MKNRLPIAFAALLLLGALVCPKPPGPSRIDPHRCFEHAFRAEAGPDSATSRRMRELIERNYTFSISGEDVVAGRKAWVLGIRPKIKQRPWRQLWIDRKTFQILALRDWSHAGKLKRSAKSPAVRPELVEGLGAASDKQSAAKARCGRVLAPGYVPPGFELAEVRASAEHEWSRIVYSDGLYAISLFQRFPDRLSWEHKHAIAVYDWGGGLLLSTFCAGRQVAVLADLPRHELERIAASIR